MNRASRLQKNNTPHSGKKQMSAVQIYWNLRRRVWSVRSVATRRVVAHMGTIDLVGGEFRVSESGRLRAVREGRRNVHAIVQGRIAPSRRVPVGPTADVHYNPFENPHFRDRATGRSLSRAARVRFLPTGRAVAYLPEFLL